MPQKKKRPIRRPLRPKQRIRRKKPKVGSRRRRRQTPKKITAVMVSPGTVDTAEQAAAKGARVRLNPGERELLAATLLATLPKSLRKALGNGGSLWDVDYNLRRKYQIQLSLISRLRTPRRGHPSTW